MEKTGRRTFLKQAGLLSLFTIVPSKVLGGSRHIAPSDQLTKGIIGVGGIGRSGYTSTAVRHAGWYRYAMWTPPTCRKRLTWDSRSST